MSKLNVTKGDWTIKENVTQKGSFLRVTTEGESICNITTRNEVRSDGNAKLIADAGTTYNKTGFTTSELAQQVEEMREALEMLYNAFPNDSKGLDILFGVHQLLTKYPKK